MKRIFVLLIILFSIEGFSQGIGEIVPDKAPTVFPKNSLGLDFVFSEGGFGIGGFYRRELFKNTTGFVDLSISEAKDEKEIEYYDWFTGQMYTVGKKNRIFLLPVIAGLQYRLFSESVADNFRPYINGGVGPTFVVTTPYAEEFFSSFKYAQSKVAFGSYVGIGANFGLNPKSLLGVNLRYYYISFFDKGVESLENRYRKTLGGVFLTINLGMMY